MNTIKVYPWHQVAWDIARAQGMDERKLDDMSPDEARKAAKTKLSAQIGLALIDHELSVIDHKLQALDADGDPILEKDVYKDDLLKSNKLYVSPEHVNPWLKANGYLYHWEPKEEACPAHVNKQTKQEDLILETIKSLRHDPLNLEKPPKGKPGIKNKVRNALNENPLFIGKTVFDKAWERLAATEQIKYKE